MRDKSKVFIFITLILCVLLTLPFSACAKNKGEYQSTLSVSKDYILIEKSETADLFAGYDGKADITFKSTNEEIVTVTSTGGHAVITAINEGVAYVRISVDGQTKTCKVEVYVPNYTIVLDREQSETVVWVGTKHRVVATIYKDGVEINDVVTWQVSGGDCLVEQTANAVVITPNEVGTYTATATYKGNISAEYVFSVVNENS